MSDRPDAFFTMFVGDYLRDTMHLTTRQHGAYQLLLMHYYGRGEPLPLSDDAIRTITRENQKEWAVDGPPVMEFFVKSEDGWHQKRADKELAKLAVRYKRSMSGVDAKKQRKGDPSTNSNEPEDPPKSELKSHLSSNSNGQQVATNHNHNHKIPLSQASRAPWPAGKEVPEAWAIVAGGELQRLGLPAVDMAASAAKFANHHSANPQPRTLTEWQARFQNWIIDEVKTHERQQRKRANGQPRSLAASIFRE